MVTLTSGNDTVDTVGVVAGTVKIIVVNGPVQNEFGSAIISWFLNVMLNIDVRTSCESLSTAAALVNEESAMILPLRKASTENEDESIVKRSRYWIPISCLNAAILSMSGRTVAKSSQNAK